jgi:hypothetical protein
MKATKKVLYSNLLPACLVVRVGKYEKLKFCTVKEISGPLNLQKFRKKGKRRHRKNTRSFPLIV